MIVGAAFETGANPKSRSNVKGAVRGFDVRTGKQLWMFRTIPQPGEFGNDTWVKDSWAYTGNTGVWAQISVDEELGIVYLPVELPTDDYYGGDRPGQHAVRREPRRRRSADRAAQVALPAGAPRPLGHGYPVRPDPGGHHGQRKNDQGGRAADQAGVSLCFRSRDGSADMADRRAPRRRRVMCPGNGIRRRSRFRPSRRRTTARDSSIDDLIDFTPELRAEAVKAISLYRIGPVFTPPVVSKAEGPIATLAMATQAAATNWPGGSYDPETHILYVHSQSRRRCPRARPAASGDRRALSPGQCPDRRSDHRRVRRGSGRAQAAAMWCR